MKRESFSCGDGSRLLFTREIMAEMCRRTLRFAGKIPEDIFLEQIRCYLLSVEELDRDESGQTLYHEAIGRLDSTRLAKVKRMNQGKARSLSVGAGLLLQLAVQENFSVQEHSDMSRLYEIFPQSVSVSEVLEQVKRPREIAYRQEQNGKPDFAEGEWHFNLSHSGEYVCCVLAPFAVGVDLQQMRAAKTDALVRRYFSDREKLLLEKTASIERSELFYRMWTRKESYAKLTGEGILSAVRWDTTGPEMKVVWQEYDVPAGYRMAICCFGNVGGPVSDAGTTSEKQRHLG